MRRGTSSLITIALCATTIALTGCPGGGVPGVPGVPGGGGDKVDPDACGSYAETDVGAKLKAFLQATATLETAVMETEAEVKVTCETMASELGIEASGSTQEVCNAVTAEIEAGLSASLTAGAKLEVKYTPPECTVNVDAAAEVAASCEANASADVAVQCSGTCSGTCSGQCDGECEGSAGTGGSGGQCEGKCNGVCQGSCSGGCEGHADVQASAECEAAAEVNANVQAECTEPEVEIAFDAKAVVDAPRVEKIKAALKAGMPKMLVVAARIGGPVKVAFATWAKSAKELAASAKKLAGSFGAKVGMCVSGQLAIAGSLVAKIQASIDVQVNVSASVSASAEAEGSAEGGAGAGI